MTETPTTGSDADDTATITLHGIDLLSKWGFADGDLADALLYAWATTDPQWCDRIDDHNSRSIWYRYLNAHLLLINLVKTHLVPTLPDHARAHVVYMSSIHNPVRLDDDAAVDPDDLGDVTVSWNQVAEVCRRLFPVRPHGWTRLYAELRWHPDIPELYGLLSDDHDEITAEHRRRTRVVDDLATSYDDDLLGLAAELLAARRCGTAATTARGVMYDGETLPDLGALYRFLAVLGGLDR